MKVYNMMRVNTLILCFDEKVGTKIVGYYILTLAKIFYIILC